MARTHKLWSARPREWFGFERVAVAYNKTKEYFLQLVLAALPSAGRPGGVFQPLNGATHATKGGKGEPRGPTGSQHEQTNGEKHQVQS